jgi:hypothetical protein
MAASPARPVGGQGFSDEDLAEALDAMRRGESLEAMAFRRLAQFTPSPSNDVAHTDAQIEQLRMIREYLDAERAKDLGFGEVAHRKFGAGRTIHRS